MTVPTDVVLYTPDMWNDLFSEGRFDFKNVEERWRAETGRAMTIDPTFDVTESGLKTDAYDYVESKASGGSHFPIMVLPIGHCAENIDLRRLKIIGPAIATRNDIFVFRRRKGLPENSIAAKKSRFTVAVREAELTTSNISRVVLHHSKLDAFFPPAGKPKHWKSSPPRFDNFHHVEKADPTTRALAVIEGKVHAAIFMGHELDILAPFAEDLIDAANLNRLANNLYSITLFPRALYVTFANQVVKSDGLETARAFASAISTEVNAYRQRTEKTRGTEFERRTQHPSLTGPEASLEEIHTIIKFTEDMYDDTFGQDRGGHEPNDDARELRPGDFLFYDDVEAPQFYPWMVEQVRQIDVAATYNRDPKGPQTVKLRKALDQVCDHLAKELVCRRDQFIERMSTAAKKLGFTSKEVERLVRAASDLIAGNRGAK